MLNFRKRLNAIQENKKEELKKIEATLEELLEEVYSALEKMSYRNYIGVKSLFFGIDKNNSNIVIVSTEKDNLLVTYKITEEIDIRQMLQMLHDKLFLEHVDAKFVNPETLEVKIK